MSARRIGFIFATLALALLGPRPSLAQVSLSPSAQTKPAQQPVIKKKPPAKKPGTEKPKPASPPAPPSTTDNDLDLAYGAYQRGYFLTAFREATKRAGESNDSKAMTLLGELYADGLGVPASDQKAVEWYRLAADRGDPNAMFALAMFNIGSRGGLHDRAAASALLASAAKLGHAAAAYDLALLYIEGQQFPQDFTRAAELLRVAAQTGNAEAQYALATFYKEGRGLAKDDREAARLLGAAALADNADAQVEYGIALFNGTGVSKNEVAAAKYFKRAALRGNAVAQNRLARLYMIGRGVPVDPVEAIKWHIAAKAGGASDPQLDEFMGRQTKEIRGAAELAAKTWIDYAATFRS
jgi:TPR repeat protein